MEATAPTTSNGAAYVFVRSGSVWAEQAKLLASDRATADLFGNDVDLAADGDRALVGARSKAAGAGAAYVFLRTAGTWAEETKLSATDGAASDNFGQAVALSSDASTALVGAHGDANSSGSAYIYVRTGSTWSEQAKLVASDRVSGDLFGWGLDLSGTGNRAVIGAYHEDDSGTTDNGAAYVFVWSGSVWQEQSKLLAADKASSDYFGLGVSLSSAGDVVLIGANYENDSGTSDNGAAYIFGL